MRSVSLWFNLTLFKKNITRFWPIWGLYLVIWLFAFPFSLIVGNRAGVQNIANNTVLTCINGVGLFLAFVFAVAAAMAVWSYLYNTKSAGMLHTLPIRREGLFLTNYLSGMAFFVGPNVLIFLLTLLAEGARGVVNAGALCMWLAALTLIELFFFSFATFCAMFTGHILCLPAFYGILNILAAGLVGLIELTMGRFVFGYSGVQGLWIAAEWLTPVYKLLNSLWVDYERGRGPWLVGLGYIIIYAFFGVVLAALALVAYRRRDIERAGDVVTVSWVRPIFQYGVAFCSALAFGTLLYIMFSGALPNGVWTLLVFMLLCGAAGCFVARMLLEKTFRVLHAWKGCVVFLAVLVVATCIMEFDLTGFERRVPRLNQVDSVRISGITAYPYDSAYRLSYRTDDPEIIQAILELHGAVVANKDEIERYDWTKSYDVYDSPYYHVDTIRSVGFSVTYTLRDGQTMSRDYEGWIPVTQALLDDPNSPAAKINALVNLPQVILSNYGLEGAAASQIIDLELTEVNVYDKETDNWGFQNVELPQESWEEICQAVLADLADGNLGRRYLIEAEERMENCYLSDLRFVFYINDDKEAQPGREEESVPAGRTQSVTVGLQTTGKRTLAALERAGVLGKEARLVTHLQELEDNSGSGQEDAELWEYGGDGVFGAKSESAKVLSEKPALMPN